MTIKNSNILSNVAFFNVYHNNSIIPYIHSNANSVYLCMGSIYKVFQKVLTFNGIFRVLAPVVRYDDVFGQPGLRSFLCHVSRTLRGTSCNHIHQKSVRFLEALYSGRTNDSLDPLAVYARSKAAWNCHFLAESGDQ